MFERSSLPTILTTTILCFGAISPGQETMRDLDDKVWHQKLLTVDLVDTWNLLDGQKDEIIRVHVESGEFDPTLKLMGEGEEPLANVDDPGSKSRFVLRLPKAGKYRILVHGHQKRGGGNYRLSVERFKASFLPRGDAIRGTIGKDGKHHHWYPAKRGEILVPKVNLGDVACEFWHPRSWTVAGWHQSAQVQHDGEHYLRVLGKPGQEYELSLWTAKAHSLENDQPQSAELPAGQMHTWEFNIQKKDFRTIQIVHDGIMNLRVGQLREEEEKKKQKGVNAPPPLPLFAGTVDMLPLPVSSKGRFHRYAFVFQRTNRYQVQLLSNSRQATKYELQVSDPSTRITAGEIAEARLPVGGARFYTFKAKPGQYFRAGLDSENFDPILRLTGPLGGELLASDDSDRGLNSQLGHMVTRAGTYRLQVASVGNGGGGAFELSLNQISIPSIAIGQSQKAKLKAGQRWFWYFEGRKDQVVFISVRSNEINPQIDLMAPRGRRLKSDDDGGVKNDSLLAIRLPVDGRYTIGVRSLGGGSGEYRIRLIEGLVD